jgi:hypothetical protein
VKESLQRLPMLRVFFHIIVHVLYARSRAFLRHDRFTNKRWLAGARLIRTEPPRVHPFFEPDSHEAQIPINGALGRIQ